MNGARRSERGAVRRAVRTPDSKCIVFLAISLTSKVCLYFCDLSMCFVWNCSGETGCFALDFELQTSRFVCDDSMSLFGFPPVFSIST